MRNPSSQSAHYRTTIYSVHYTDGSTKREMFYTDDAAEVAYPFQVQGEHIWEYVTRGIHAPWFHVVLEHKPEEGPALRHMMFLSHFTHLQELGGNADLRIIEVDIVSPGHVNGSSRWRMEPLSEIWIASEPDGSQRAAIFVLENGIRYTGSALLTPANQLKKDRLFFRSPGLRQQGEG